MCMGCMSNADFVVASGILGAASVRAGLRNLLPNPPAFLRKVTDEEAAAFVASMTAGPEASERSAEPAPAELDPVG